MLLQTEDKDKEGTGKDEENDDHYYFSLWENSRVFFFLH